LWTAGRKAERSGGIFGDSSCTVKYTGKSWLTVVKVLRDTITEKVISHESSKDKMEFLAGLANFIHDKPPPLDGSAENFAPEESS